MANPVQTCEFEVEPKCPSGNPIIRKIACPDLLNCMRNFVYRNRTEIESKPDGPKGGTKGLKYRHEEQADGECGPGTKVWKDHDEQIRGLTKKLSAYGWYFVKNGCGSLPSDLHGYMKKDPPRPADWKGDRNAAVPDKCNKGAKEVDEANSEEETNKDQNNSNMSMGFWGWVGVGALGLGAVAALPIEAPVAGAAAVVIGLGALIGIGGGHGSGTAPQPDA